jgi:hypothetical protein
MGSKIEVSLRFRLSRFFSLKFKSSIEPSFRKNIPSEPSQSRDEAKKASLWPSPPHVRGKGIEAKENPVNYQTHNKDKDPQNQRFAKIFVNRITARIGVIPEYAVDRINEAPNAKTAHGQEH